MKKKGSGQPNVKQPANNKKGKTKTDAVSEEKPKGALKAANAINVRHILCEKHAKATEALNKIKDDGQAFNKVAEEYSEDKAKAGGSLGWMSRGSMVKVFEEVAFALEPSKVEKPNISGLVKTQHGYHIIMVEGRR